MRTFVMTLGLALLVSVSPTAQIPASLPSLLPTIKPPSDVRHHLNVVTVAPCPVR